MLNYRSRLLKTQGMSTKVRVVLCVFGLFVCFIENAKILANGNCDKPPTTNSVGGVGGWCFFALFKSERQPQTRPTVLVGVGGWWFVALFKSERQSPT